MKSWLKAFWVTVKRALFGHGPCEQCGAITTVARVKITRNDRLEFFGYMCVPCWRTANHEFDRLFKEVFGRSFWEK